MTDYVVRWFRITAIYDHFRAVALLLPMNSAYCNRMQRLWLLLSEIPQVLKYIYGELFLQELGQLGDFKFLILHSLKGLYYLEDFL